MNFKIKVPNNLEIPFSFNRSVRFIILRFWLVTVSDLNSDPVDLQLGWHKGEVVRRS